MKILHLYHDLMNLYGEYGNVVVLKKHLLDQGLEVVVERKSVGDKIEFNDYDFVYMGSGSERNQEVVLNDLLKYRNDIKRAVDNNQVLLFTGNAMELLGESIDDKKALNIVPIKTKTTKNRYTGDVIVNNEKLGELVGFINKCSLIEENRNISLFDYVFKDINIQDNEYEGYHINNLYGTHIIGPILVKNPAFMRNIVEELLGKDKAYKELSYPFEEDSYNVTLKQLKERNK